VFLTGAGKNPLWLAKVKGILYTALLGSRAMVGRKPLAWAKERALAGRAGPGVPSGADHQTDLGRDDDLAAGAVAVAGLSTLDLESLLQRLVERMVQFSGAVAGAILLLDEKEQVLRPGAYYGLGKEEPHSFHVPVGEGFAGRVAAERRPVVIPDDSGDPELLNPYIRQHGIKAMLGVPVTVGQTLLGVAHVDRLDDRPFTPHEVKRLEAMAAQAALAIQHALLHGQLARANQRLQTVIETMPAGVAIIEAPGGRVVLANRAAEALWGHPPLPEVGFAGLQSAYGFYQLNGAPYDWRSLPMARSILTGETVAGEEMLLKRRDGKESFVLVSSAPVHDAEGSVEAAVVVFQDMSGMKLELLKDEFVAVTAHELFTPLTIIKGSAQLLARQLTSEGRDRDIAAVLRTIDGRANWMVHLLRKMADAAEIQLEPLQLRLTQTDLVTLTKATLRRFSTMSDRHDLILVGEPDHLYGEWDRERVERVLANLIDNAIQYSPDGGRIEVEIRRIRLRNPLDPASGADGREWALVRVTDPGLGIPKEQQAFLFRRFYRAGPAQHQESAGLGLGLYIANRIVSAHGGQMCLESEPGQGSSFYFTLPLEGPEETA